MRRLILHRFRQDRLPLALYVITFIVMSYPLIFQMNDHLPMDNVDTHHALWQNWWVLQAVTHGYDVNHTDLLFYPNGLDLTLLPPRWASLPVWIPLYTLFGDPLAFNLTAILGILFKAYGMYLLGLYLFKKRIPAWVTGAFYAFAATSLQMAMQQPLTGATEWIPWFMLAYVYGITNIKAGKQSRRTLILIMVIAGLLFAMNAYANLKIAIFAMLLGGGFALLYMLWHHLWRVTLFWLAMVVFGVSAVGFSLPVLIPVLQSTDLAEANDGVIENGGIDILSFFKAKHNRPFNYMQLIASFRGEQLEVQNIWGMSHVGFVSIAFVLMGLLYAWRKNRTVFIWGILALVFWSLSLGVEIRYYRELITTFTPYGLLENNFIFQTIKWAFRLSLVFLFPFSILIGYGLHYRLQSLTLTRRQWGLLILSVCMLLYGTSIFPIPMRPAPRPAYVQALKELPDGAIIDLPFGRHNAKYYMSIQRFHQRPMIEGMIARVPPGTYDYIDTNPVLSAMQGNADYTVADIPASAWQPALQQLIDDGFQYIILHRTVPQTSTRIEYPARTTVALFSGYTPTYADDDVLIYSIKALQSEIPDSLLKDTD